MKPNFKSSKLAVYAFALLAVPAAWFGQYWALKFNADRYFLILAVPVLIAAFGALTYGKYRHLQSITDETIRKKQVAGLKLGGEVAAAIALSTFAVPYFQVGLDLDRMAFGPRQNIFISASRILNAELTSDFCASRQIGADTCEHVQASMVLAITGVVARDEMQVHRAVESAVFHLENMVTAEHGSLRGQQLQRAISLLNSLDLSAELTTQFMRVFSMLALLWALAAVSRKVAVAWDDYSRLKAGPVASS